MTRYTISGLTKTGGTFSGRTMDAENETDLHAAAAKEGFSGVKIISSRPILWSSAHTVVCVIAIVAAICVSGYVTYDRSGSAPKPKSVVSIAPSVAAPVVEPVKTAPAKSTFDGLEAKLQSAFRSAGVEQYKLIMPAAMLESLFFFIKPFTEPIVTGDMVSKTKRDEVQRVYLAKLSEVFDGRVCVECNGMKPPTYDPDRGVFTVRIADVVATHAKSSAEEVYQGQNAFGVKVEVTKSNSDNFALILPTVKPDDETIIDLAIIGYGTLWHERWERNLKRVLRHADVILKKPGANEIEPPYVPASDIGEHTAFSVDIPCSVAGMSIKDADEIRFSFMSWIGGRIVLNKNADGLAPNAIATYRSRHSPTFHRPTETMQTTSVAVFTPEVIVVSYEKDGKREYLSMPVSMQGIVPTR